MSATTCLVVDDHSVVQQGLNLLFADLEDVELVGTVESGEDAIDAVARLQPQIVLMDVRLPGIDGVSTVKRLQQAAPSVQFVMFSAYGDKRLLSDALAAGARGYVLKGSPPEDLVRAIRTVAAGKPFVDPSLSPALLISDARNAESALSEGYHTEEVARRIGLSVETVKADTKRVIARLQADTRTHAVAIALRRTLID